MLETTVSLLLSLVLLTDCPPTYVVTTSISSVSLLGLLGNLLWFWNLRRKEDARALRTRDPDHRYGTRMLAWQSVSFIITAILGFIASLIGILNIISGSDQHRDSDCFDPMRITQSVLLALWGVAVIVFIVSICIINR
jgi:hypothetical protein